MEREEPKSDEYIVSLCLRQRVENLSKYIIMKAHEGKDESFCCKWTKAQ